jgi:hypothetical protein
MASSANQNKKINIFLLEKDGNKKSIGYIKHYIRDALGKPTNFSRNESNLLPFVPMNAGILPNHSLISLKIDLFNSFLLDHIKKDVIHQRSYDLAIKQIFNVFFIEGSGGAYDPYDPEIIGILFYKTQTTTHNIYFVYRKIKYIQGNRETEKVNFLCYLVRCKNDDGGYPRLLKKDYSIEDAKNDLLEQIPIFYEKLRKISSGLLPRNNTNINRAFVNKSFGNN